MKIHILCAFNVPDKGQLERANNQIELWAARFIFIHSCIHACVHFNVVFFSFQSALCKSKSTSCTDCDGRYDEINQAIRLWKKKKKQYSTILITHWLLRPNVMVPWKRRNYVVAQLTAFIHFINNIHDTHVCQTDRPTNLGPTMPMTQGGPTMKVKQFNIILTWILSQDMCPHVCHIKI